MAARLRILQDKFLKVPEIRDRIQQEGEHARIAGHDSPTFHEVWTDLLPEWEGYFTDYLSANHAD